MIKKTAGWILFISSYPFILGGGVLFVINLLLFSSSLAAKNLTDFVTPIILAIVGIVFRLIGQRLQRISY